MNDFWNKVLPGSVKTDHGKFNGTDLMIVVITLILFGFTCFRSFRFLQATFSGEDTTGMFTIMSIVGLVGLDIATIAWALVWMFGSTTKWQDVVAMVMFVVSIIGMVLTSMTDTLRGEGSVPEVLLIAAFYGVPAIILANVVAAILYHMISPQVTLGRKERRLKADMLETQRLGKLAQTDTAMKLTLAEEQSRQNEQLIERQKILAQQHMVLDGERLGISRAMSDDTPVKQRGEAVLAQLRNAVLPSADPAPQPRVVNETVPMLPPQPSSQPAPLQSVMFLVHLTQQGSAETWMLSQEIREGVHWDAARGRIGVLVRAENHIAALQRAEEIAKSYVSNDAPKA